MSNGAASDGAANGAAAAGEPARLFVCVDLSPAAVADLGAVVDQLEVARADQPGHSTRLAARDRWHLTLVFLGDVPADRVDRAGDALAAAVVGRSPVELRMSGGGTFGRGGFTILWAGVGGDVAGLKDLSTAVRTELRRARIPFDRKPLRPHLTISRPGSRVEPDLIARDVATLSAYTGPQWTVDNLHLVRSALGPRPTYTTLRVAPLG